MNEFIQEDAFFDVNRVLLDTLTAVKYTYRNRETMLHLKHATSVSRSIFTKVGVEEGTTLLDSLGFFCIRTAWLLSFYLRPFSNDTKQK